ncbi:hypothetical protein AC578_4019 [Pseudocercospora eumusae]|uniref:JmjC domain-containing protein n=1 Tax=Pseudocercospora eumusae TaxID=321146 RepID=A0A139HDW3_9PEZI|nr:hypothetical protein AC578_4019 [Pseudocercospora eumusae]
METGERREPNPKRPRYHHQHSRDSESLGLGHETTAWLKSLFTVHRKRSSMENFAQLRDGLLQAEEDLLIRFNTLLEVVKLHFPGVDDDPAWASVNKTVQRQNHEPDATHGEKWRRRHLAIITALWGPQVIMAYGIQRLAQQPMSCAHKCAIRCPNFNDFVPFVNAALLVRHRKAVQSARWTRISGKERITGPDVKLAHDFLTARSDNGLPAVDDDQKLWTSNQLGDFLVGKKLLREWHSSIQPWLLTTDYYGVLAPRESLSPITEEEQAPRPQNSRIKLRPANVHTNAKAQDNAASPPPSRPRGKRPFVENAQQPSQKKKSPPKNKPVGNRPSSRSSKTTTSNRPLSPLPLPNTSLEEPNDAPSSTSGSSRGDQSASDPQSSYLPADGSELNISDGPVVAQVLTVEEVMHNKYHKELQDYCSAIHSHSGRSTQHAMRAQWLTPRTRYAKIHGSVHRSSGSSDPEMADVLYYTSQDFIRTAENGMVFEKPIVIKEAFTDSAYHSIENFKGLLLDSYKGKKLDVRKLSGSQPIATPVHKIFRDISDIETGYNALNLRDVAKAQRPLFTLLSRFRLLDKLVESVKVHTGKDVKSAPIDVASCISFNILGMKGAFSGAHMDALAGTWVRNLDGVKLWMIVPRSEVDDTFRIRGDSWSPGGKERLVILEKDDVLLMPPGTPVVHAVHSLRPSLMAGGMLWDDLTIISTLELLFNIGEHQNMTNEEIGYQLADVIDALERLVKAGTTRFRGSLSHQAFLSTFNDALRQLRSLGCRCAYTHSECSCARALRRCTSLCSRHPRLPPDTSSPDRAESEFHCMRADTDTHGLGCSMCKHE